MASIRLMIPSLVVLSFVVCPICRGEVVFDNFDLGGGFNSTYNKVAAQSSFHFAGFDNRRLAVQFSVAGNDYELSSVTIPIAALIFGNGNDDKVRLRITDDAGGAPGTTLEVLSENETIWPTNSYPTFAPTTVLSNSNPLLQSGMNYWLVLEPSAIARVGGINDGFLHRWFYNTNGPEVPFIQQQTRSMLLPVDPWPPEHPTNKTEPFAFRVEGSVVPEPSCPLVSLTGACLMGTHFRRKRV